MLICGFVDGLGGGIGLSHISSFFLHFLKYFLDFGGNPNKTPLRPQATKITMMSRSVIDVAKSNMRAQPK